MSLLHVTPVITIYALLPATSMQLLSSVIYVIYLFTVQVWRIYSSRAYHELTDTRNQEQYIVAEAARRAQVIVYSMVKHSDDDDEYDQECASEGFQTTSYHVMLAQLILLTCSVPPGE